MNEVIKQLHARKSVRVFEDREIPADAKAAILAAACQAPTAGNQQLYTILDITDQPPLGNADGMLLPGLSGCRLPAPGAGRG